MADNKNMDIGAQERRAIKALIEAVLTILITVNV
jgi:hypothetical protein